MSFELPALPYDAKALEPHLSRALVQRRHGELQRACLARLNRLVAGTPWAERPLEAILLGAEGEIAQQAAQAWALTFHWHSLAPRSGAPGDALAAAIEARWGGLEGLRAAMAVAVVDGPAGGWAWLVRDGEGVALMMGEAGSVPLSRGLTPLLALRLADAPDTQGPAALAAFWALANWRFATTNFSGPAAPRR
ncbi:Fe-Mn family superoxide dismutase [Halomonas sp. H10-9-1]|uniref:superoxide dismutase n=1 Tax=Halomonas sp. H10-9-1 TaxID=2950871 RepID=UPI0032E0554D